MPHTRRRLYTVVSVQKLQLANRAPVSKFPPPDSITGAGAVKASVTERIGENSAWSGTRNRHQVLSPEKEQFCGREWSGNQPDIRNSWGKRLCGHVSWMVVPIQHGTVPQVSIQEITVWNNTLE